MISNNNIIPTNYIGLCIGQSVVYLYNIPDILYYTDYTDPQNTELSLSDGVMFCLRNSGEQFIQRFPSKPEQYIINHLHNNNTIKIINTILFYFS